MYGNAEDLEYLKQFQQRAKLEDFELTEATVIKGVWFCLSTDIKVMEQNSDVQKCDNTYMVVNFL